MIKRARRLASHLRTEVSRDAPPPPHRPQGDEATLASVGSDRCSELCTSPIRLLHFLGSVLAELLLRNRPP